MEHTGIKPKVIEEIRTFARKYNIDKVILFGSRARGDYRRTSDIDLFYFIRDSFVWSERVFVGTVS